MTIKWSVKTLDDGRQLHGGKYMGFTLRVYDWKGKRQGGQPPVNWHIFDPESDTFLAEGDVFSVDAAKRAVEDACANLR